MKYNKKYTGKTTAYEHKFGEDWKESPGFGDECIEAMNVFEVQWSNCPDEVEKEVRQLWKDDDRLGNDAYYYSWDGENEDSGDGSDLDEMCDQQRYPVIAAYLKSRGIEKCLIHWWW